jgi:hypothetical protein
MPFIVSNGSKPFEKPDSGVFNGTLADVVDLGVVPTKFGAKAKVRLVWVLDKNDSEGRPFRVIRQVTASLNEKAQLFDVVKSILGTAPPVPYDIEALIGKSNQLVIIKEAVGDKVFVNVKGILPLPVGLAAPKIPADFVRAKDKKNQPVTQAASANSTIAPTVEVEDDDIPF